jgi:D-glycero-D-manno-heptose 1,7-bisphosphate phosphatase
MRAVFLDRDGTVTVGIPTYERVDSIDKVELLPGVLEALTLLAGLDYGVFFVTNQAGIAEGLLTKARFNTINAFAIGLLAPSGIRILKTYCCPHGEHANCTCRKPKPRMLLQAAEEYAIDLKQSYMIGDRISDVMTGINAGSKTILVQTGTVKETSDIATYSAPTLLAAIQYVAAHTRQA